MIFKLWFKIRFHYLCWRYGTEFVFDSMEKHLPELGATLELDTPEKRVYRWGDGEIVIMKKKERK